MEQGRWKIFSDAAVTPEAWQASAPLIFLNNAVHRHEGELIMAYRVIDREQRRKISLCKLLPDWSVVPGSATAFSDEIVANTDGMMPEQASWYADARLFSVGRHLFLHYNTGSSPKPNAIMLVEVDPVSLKPVGMARPVITTYPRREVEKNWTFFENADAIYAIYSFSPLVILRVDLSDPNVVRCEPAFTHIWDASAYNDIYGEMRGGATPVLHEGHLYFVGHSIFKAGIPFPPGRTEDLCYVGCLFATDGSPPFRPAFLAPRPILEVTPREMALPHEPRADPRCIEDVYPCGAFIDGDDLVVSYGLNNRYLVMRSVPIRRLAQTLVPALPVETHLRPAFLTGPSEAEPAPAIEAGAQVNAFWWQPDRVTPRSPLLEKRNAKYFLHGNFGDLFVPPLLGRITGVAPINATSGPRLFTIGSVLCWLNDGDAVWGAGVKGGVGMLNSPKNLHIYALRGPISLQFMKKHGYDVSRVSALFDPGILTGSLFASEIAQMRARRDSVRHPFILIPHLHDQSAMLSIYSNHADRIRSVDAPFFELVGDILDSELVISSSLHGLIIAESLGVPAIWHAPVTGEDELKYTDYYLGTDRWKILRVDSVTAALRASPMPLPKIDTEAILATFPTRDELTEIGIIRNPD